MSFIGDLEHMPIVDVVQLLHATRKSGILTVSSRRGESSLVFKDGYIVCANHLNSSLRIGDILVERGLITRETLDAALQAQDDAGAARKPLIITLLQNEQVGEHEAYRALEYLIEQTVVEILTWKQGTFSLDMSPTHTSDGYRYYPERMNKEINIDTQEVLMDALRIYDERMRDGTLSREEPFVATASQEAPPTATVEDKRKAAPAPPAANASTALPITADDLGLADMDALEKRIPDVFMGVKAIDPAELHRRELAGVLREMPLGTQEKLLSFLVDFASTAGQEGDAATPARTTATVILFSSDPLVRHIVATVCRRSELFVFATDEEPHIDRIIDQTIAKGLTPLLVIDAPNLSAEGFSADRTASLWLQKMTRYPALQIVQLTTPRDYELSLQAFTAGIGAVLPRPSLHERRDTVGADTMEFTKALQTLLKGTLPSPSGDDGTNRFVACIRELDTLSTAADISAAILSFAAGIFERALTLVVTKNGLIAEQGIGISGDKHSGPTPPLRFSIPLDQSSIFRETVEQGRLFHGASADPLLHGCLYDRIGAPLQPIVLLAPISCFGRVIALLYGDFGAATAGPVPLQQLESLTRHAGVLLDNAMYRKKLQPSGN